MTLQQRWPSLLPWGYGPDFEPSLTDLENTAGPGLCPGRVVRLDRGRALVHDGEAVHGLPLTGRIAQDPLAVGDFVALSEGRDRIVGVLLRRQLLARRRAGSKHGVQPLAANLDEVWLCAPADRLNPAWVERGLALVWDCGAQPRVVLTKADLLADVSDTLDELADRALGAAVCAVSVHQPETVQALEAALAPGQTAALLGASGAGKSSLLNALLGHEVAATSAVRDGDKKGRHTTVHRELFMLPGGGLLVDTPGTRELGLWLGEGGAGSGFVDIDALAADCRFRDCAHQDEPGCAVRAAVDDGDLDPDRYESFLRQGRERRWLEETDHERRTRERGFGRMVKDAQARKNRDG